MPAAAGPVGLTGGACAWLVADAAIAGVMGQGHETRIAPGKVPQGGTATSSIEVRRVGTRHIGLLPGGYAAMKRGMLQIDVWTRNQDTREVLAELVRRRMRTWSGVWGTVDVREVAPPELDSDDDFDPADGSSERDWRTVLRYPVWHRNLAEI